MKEKYKYDVIKELVDHGGNKKRAILQLGITQRLSTFELKSQFLHL